MAEAKFRVQCFQVDICLDSTAVFNNPARAPGLKRKSAITLIALFLISSKKNKYYHSLI